MWNHEFIEVGPLWRNKIAKCLCSNTPSALPRCHIVRATGVVKHVIKEKSSLGSQWVFSGLSDRPWPVNFSNGNVCFCAQNFAIENFFKRMI